MEAKEFQFLPSSPAEHKGPTGFHSLSGHQWGHMTGGEGVSTISENCYWQDAFSPGTDSQEQKTLSIQQFLPWNRDPMQAFKPLGDGWEMIISEKLPQLMTSSALCGIAAQTEFQPVL